MAERNCSRGDSCGGRGGDLEAHRSLIKQLYVEDDLPLKAVVEILRTQHGVNASPNMYKKKLRQWEMKKADNGHEIVVLVRADANQKHSRNAFRVRGKKISGTEVQKFSKWESMHPASLAAHPSVNDAVETAGASVSGTSGTNGSAASRFDRPGVFTPYTPITPTDSSAAESDATQGFPCESSLFNKGTSDASTCLSSSRFVEVVSDPQYWYVTGSSPDQAIVPHSQFMNAMGIHLRARSLRRIASPKMLEISEQMFYSMHYYIARLLMPRLVPIAAITRVTVSGRMIPVSQRPKLFEALEAQEFDLALFNGLVTFRKSGISRATASFEQAFRQVGKMICNEDYNTLQHFLEAVVLSRTHGMPQLGVMVLQQVSHLASIIHSPEHPYAVWARNLLVLIDVSGALESVATAIPAIIEDVLGSDDIYAINSRGSEYDLVDKVQKIKDPTANSDRVIQQYRSLLNDVPASSVYNTVRLNVTAGLSGKYTSIGAYDQAAELYLEYIPKLEGLLAGDKSLNLNPLPTLRAVIACGKNMMRQGKFEDARPILGRGLSGSLQLLGHDHPITIEAIAWMGDCLKSLKLDDDARAMHSHIDSSLAPFMLGPQMCEGAMG